MFFRDRVSLCSPGCPGTHSVDQVGLELRNPPASASASAGIKGVSHHCLAWLSFCCGQKCWLYRPGQENSRFVSLRRVKEFSFACRVSAVVMVNVRVRAPEP